MTPHSELEWERLLEENGSFRNRHTIKIASSCLTFERLKMAEGKSSVAIGCYCDDKEDPFPRTGWYSNTWRCEFVLLSRF